MKKTTIYLLRHSEQFNMYGSVNTFDNCQVQNEKIILSMQGEEKAKNLSELAELQNIDVLFSSNYVRAISTAKYIGDKNHIAINIDDRIGERRLGDLKELENLR